MEIMRERAEVVVEHLTLYVAGMTVSLFALTAAGECATAVAAGQGAAGLDQYTAGLLLTWQRRRIPLH